MKHGFPALLLLVSCLHMFAAGAPGRPVIDALQAGIIGDGATLNTAMIQKAIDECAAGGGGTIRFPAGRYLTGTIQIKSHVTLQLERDATLLGSPEIAHYRNLDPFLDGLGDPMGHALVVAVDADNVGIEGDGTIDGQGRELKARQQPYKERPFLVRWVRCTNVKMRGVHLTNPGAWTLNFFQSKNIVIEGVTIRSRNSEVHNADGIDLDSCQGARVTDCDIESGDDAFCLKATSLVPTRDITAMNLKLSTTCNAIKLGTESIGGFEAISVSNCRIANVGMAGIALYAVDGGDLHHVTITDIAMDRVGTPVSIRRGARLKTFREGDQPRLAPGQLRDVTIRNVNAKNVGTIGLLINGVRGFPVEALTFENIQLEVPGGGIAEDAKVQLPENEKAYPENRMFGKTLPAYGIYARHVHGAKFQNVQITPLKPDARPAAVLVDTEDVTPASLAAEIPREHLSLDANWRFHLGDDWPRALDLSKAGASTGPAAEKFDDSTWRVLDVPHDWAVELPFDKAADRNHGFKPVGPGFAANSIGWYRRTLELPKEDDGKRIWLTFDGVFRNATVWVNGWLVSRHESGYSPLRADITDVVRFGAKNVVTVRVDATEPEGWFYEGAGIYRHVWLDKTAPAAVAPEGIFVRSEFAGNFPVSTPEIKVDVTLLNSQPNAVNATVSCVIVSPAGKSLPVFSGSAPLEADSTRTLTLNSTVAAPALWSPESPALYQLVTTVSVEGKIVDQKETSFGIRTVAFDKDRGFLLNGRPYVLKGTCNHQDHAGVGAAIPDALQDFRIAKLKEMGSNAYRTSHNPPTPELLDACDRLGMIVMDEGRLLGSDAENLRKLDDLVLRDRNHPSVCIWSVANEEFSVQSTPQGANAARTMQNHVKRLDPTRPVTYAAPQGDTFDGINGVIEVRGWNYHVGAAMDAYHAKHPDQPNVGTEQASVLGTRGIYEDDAKRGYVRAYDDRGQDTAEAWWSYFAERSWLSGAFVWTGFDYRGEPTPYGWPCISSHFGILDTCGFPKDSFYYYQSWWGTAPVLHLVPHWNWPGKEGQEIHVDALSNCNAVELFLNGKSLGRQTMKPNSKLTWKVGYAPGTLSAKGFAANGQVIAETEVETTGEPVAVKLTRDLTGLSDVVKADGKDLVVFTVSAVDAKGREVPTAQNKINFALEGAGRIIGVGNGDPSCHEPDVFLAPEMRIVPVSGWRWKVVSFPTASDASCPVLSAGSDESDWNVVRPGTNATVGDLPLWEGRTAVYRAHVKLTEEDLSSPGVRIRFQGCGGHGWYFINGQLVGESRRWEEQPSFDIKQHLHAGDNVIAVGVQHGGRWAGLNPNVNLEISPKVSPVKWSRSLFNGRAQIIVQSAKAPGEIKLTANADGMKPAIEVIETVAAPLRSSVP